MKPKNKEDLTPLAVPYFEARPDKQKIYATSDGQFFWIKSPWINHAYRGPGAPHQSFMITKEEALASKTKEEALAKEAVPQKPAAKKAATRKAPAKKATTRKPATKKATTQKPATKEEAPAKEEQPQKTE